MGTLQATAGPKWVIDKDPGRPDKRGWKNHGLDIGSLPSIVKIEFPINKKGFVLFFQEMVL